MFSLLKNNAGAIWGSPITDSKRNWRKNRLSNVKNAIPCDKMSQICQSPEEVLLVGNKVLNNAGSRSSSTNGLVLLLL